MKVELAQRHAQVDASFLDGRDVMRVVVWPAAGTVLDFLSNFRDVEPSFQVHPCFSGCIVGGLRSLTYVAACMGALATFSMTYSFVDGSR